MYVGSEGNAIMTVMIPNPEALKRKAELIAKYKDQHKRDTDSMIETVWKNIESSMECGRKEFAQAFQWKMGFYHRVLDYFKAIGVKFINPVQSTQYSHTTYTVDISCFYDEIAKGT